MQNMYNPTKVLEKVPSKYLRVYLRSIVIQCCCSLASSGEINDSPGLQTRQQQRGTLPFSKGKQKHFLSVTREIMTGLHPKTMFVPEFSLVKILPHSWCFFFFFHSSMLCLYELQNLKRRNMEDKTPTPDFLKPRDRDVHFGECQIVIC